MCNIHFIKPIKEKITDADTQELLKMLTKSANINRDGFGVFSEKGIYKRPTKFIATKHTKTKIIENFRDSEFLIGHNRYTTSGELIKEHTHPIETENLVYVHNGHISNYEKIDKDMKFDSFAIGRVIEESLKKEETIPLAIEKGLERLTGYLSVFLYHKPTKQIFYMVKGACFQFKLLRGMNGRMLIVGDTDNDNVEEYGNDLKEEIGFTIKDYIPIATYDLRQNTIYKISDEGIEKVGNFELKAEPIKVYPTAKDKTLRNHWGYYNGYNYDWEREDEADGITTMTETKEALDKIPLGKESIMGINEKLEYLLGTGSTVHKVEKLDNGKEIENGIQLFHIYTNKFGREMLKEFNIPYRFLNATELCESVEELSIHIEGDINKTIDRTSIEMYQGSRYPQEY